MPVPRGSVLMPPPKVPNPPDTTVTSCLVSSQFCEVPYRCQGATPLYGCGTCHQRDRARAPDTRCAEGPRERLQRSPDITYLKRRSHTDATFSFDSLSTWPRSLYPLLPRPHAYHLRPRARILPTY